MFFLADRCLGTRIAQRVRISGSRITTIQEEWPGRDLRSDAPPDEEIIRHLGGKAGHRALRITQDWDAYTSHGQVLHASQISVLWLRWAKYSNFSVKDKSRMLQMVIETVSCLLSRSNGPVYLQVRFDPNNRYQPLLERLQGTLLDRPPTWERIQLS